MLSMFLFWVAILSILNILVVKKKKKKRRKKVLVGEVTASIILDLLYLVLVCYKRLSDSKGIVSRANTGAQGHTITQ